MHSFPIYWRNIFMNKVRAKRATTPKYLRWEKSKKAIGQRRNTEISIRITESSRRKKAEMRKKAKEKWKRHSMKKENRKPYKVLKNNFQANAGKEIFMFCFYITTSGNSRQHLFSFRVYTICGQRQQRREKTTFLEINNQSKENKI